MTDRTQQRLDAALRPASTRIPLPTYAAPTVFVAFGDGSVDVVDTVAVEQAARGHRSGWTLTLPEIEFAAPFLFDLVPYSVICTRLGVSAKRLKALFPKVGPFRDSAARPGARSKAPAECGTTRGYNAHKAKGEPRCQPCKDANAAADRRYRLTGTTLMADDHSKVKDPLPPRPRGPHPYPAGAVAA